MKKGTKNKGYLFLSPIFEIACLLLESLLLDTSDTVPLASFCLDRLSFTTRYSCTTPGSIRSSKVKQKEVAYSKILNQQSSSEYNNFSISFDVNMKDWHC